MQKTSAFPCLLLMAFALSGCVSIPHYVAKDYPAYLQRKPEPLSPGLPFKVVYKMGDALEAHEYSFRAASVGYIHVWIVQLGMILPQFLESKGLRPSDLSQAAASPAPDLLTFDLGQYVFLDGTAHVVLSVRQIRSNKEILYKHYSGDGDDESRMAGLIGPFGMTHRVLRSTTVALDSIYGQIVKDLNSEARP